MQQSGRAFEGRVRFRDPVVYLFGRAASMRDRFLWDGRCTFKNAFVEMSPADVLVSTRHPVVPVLLLTGST